MLKRNVVYLQKNAQPKGDFGRGSYGKRREQIM